MKKYLLAILFIPLLAFANNGTSLYRAMIPCIQRGTAGAVSTPFGAWKYKAQVTFIGAGSTPLTNFPVLVEMSAANVQGFDPAQSMATYTNGGDVRFSDSSGNVVLNHEIESWSTNPVGVSSFWVQVPLLTNNTQIVAYWGYPTNTASYSTNGATWDSNFECVYHMQTLNAIQQDSTSNRWDATLGNLGSEVITNGIVGNAVNFTNGNAVTGSGYMQSVKAFLPNGVGTISTIHNRQTFSGYTMDSSASTRFVLDDGDNVASKTLSYYDGTAWFGLGGASMVAGKWQYQSYVFNHPMNVATGYLDGVALGGNTFAAATPTNFTFFNYSGSSLGNTFNPCVGAFQEVRVSKTVRSTDWIRAESQTVLSNSLFQMYGPTAGSNPTESSTITFSGYSRSEVLTNFPALVAISSNTINGFSYSQMSNPSQGYDLRFYQSGVPLNYDISSWNNKGTSYVWVRVPILSNNASFRMDWGGSASTQQLCMVNGSTWTDGYSMVWHLSDGAGSSVKDSTTNQATGTATGGYAWQTGIVDGDLNSAPLGTDVDTLVQTPNGPACNIGVDGSYCSLMAYPLGFVDQGSSGNQLLVKGNVDNYAASGWMIGINNGNQVNLRMADGVNTVSIFSSPWTLNKWHQVGWIRNGNSVYFYIDGVLVGSDTTTLTGGSQSTRQLSFAGDWSYAGRNFLGSFDEVRLGTKLRSGNWMWAEYQSMASNSLFQTYGAKTP